MPEPEEFDEELVEAAKEYWATRSTSTLGFKLWPSGSRPGLNEDKGLGDLIAVKNKSSKVVYVVVSTGKESLFLTNMSASSQHGTSVNINAALKATVPTPGGEVGVGAKYDSTAGNELKWEARPDDDPRVLTGKRVPAGRKELISTGDVANVYLHFYFDYGQPHAGLWGKKVSEVPVIKFGYFYKITDDDLDFYADARFDHSSVQQQLPSS